MSARIRTALWLFLAACVVAAGAVPALASLVQQRAQIAVTVIVNVTPAPVAFAGRQARGSADEPAVEGRLRPATIAQAAAQSAVRVEAKVTPNPTATLLYSDQPSVVINATAGTSVAVPCAFHVNVKTAIANWQIKHGVSNDFAADFKGGSLANDTYLATPMPTSTPYVVYATDGNVWAQLGTNTGTKTYCVDLTVTVPVAVAGGAYSTNAVYTLYW